MTAPAAFHKIRAIAFDLDNTLWNVGPVIERAEARLQEWLQEHCPRVAERYSPEDMRAARMELAAEEPHNAHDFTYLRMTALTRHAQDCGYEPAAAERAFEIFFAARNDIQLYDDVRPALDRLRARYTLATLSNGNADLARVGVAELFTVSLNARDVGASKPHRRGFERLAAALGLAPEDILYVGDDPDHDIRGARAAGLRTAWMNRRRERWPSDAFAPDISVADCLQLATRLEV